MLDGLTLANFFRSFSSEKCVFLFHVQWKLSLFFGKTITPKNGLLIFLGKETHSETKSWKSSRILTKKSYNNNGKPWKSSRILRHFLLFFGFFSSLHPPPLLLFFHFFFFFLIISLFFFIFSCFLFFSFVSFFI